MPALSDDDIAAMLDDDAVSAHRARALSPDHPVLRGSAQNPDVFFQSREAANPFYLNCPAIVQAAMDRFAALTGRSYRLFDYEGAPDAERVIVMMGSGSETVGETVAALNARGERVGLLKVRLFRPFSVSHLVRALPATVRHIAVLDRAKEPGAAGEPLYLDVVAALSETVGAGDRAVPLLPARDRRTLRPRVQGVHARHGRRRLRRARRAGAADAFHHRHRRRRDVSPACRGTRTSPPPATIR